MIRPAAAKETVDLDIGVSHDHGGVSSGPLRPRGQLHLQIEVSEYGKMFEIQGMIFGAEGTIRVFISLLRSWTTSRRIA